MKIRLLRRYLARHRFLLYVESVLIWLLFVVAIFYAISFFVIPSVAEAKLKKLCGGSVNIQSGRFGGFGKIHLAGVVIAEDDQAILNAPILLADQVEIQFDRWKLLRARFAVHSIGLSDFLLTADYDPGTKRWNLGGLSFQRSTLPAGKPPLLQIQRGAVRVRQTGTDGTDVLATVSIKGQIGVPAGKGQYGFILETDGRFGFGPSKLEGLFRTDKKETQLSATGQIAMPEAGILQNKWDMRDIKLEAAVSEESVVIKEFSFLMGPGNAQMDAVIGRTGNRPLAMNIGLHGLTLSDRFDPGTISYGWLLESPDSGFARFLERFHPAGAGELDLSIKGNLDDLSQTRLDGLILCKDISIRDANFPYRIEHMQGDIEFAGRTIRLKEIQARHGEVHLVLDGTVTNAGPQTAIEFRVTSQDMLFDKDLYQSLSKKVKRAWYDFTPEGLAATDYHYWRTPDGDEGKKLELELKSLSATYKHFPYPLKNLTGKVILQPQQLCIQDVLSTYEDGGQIKVAGEVLQQQAAESVFDIRILGKDISVDQQLIRALPQRYGTFFKRLETDGTAATADFEVTVFPDKADERFLDYSAEIEVQADTLRHEDFPLPMTDVELAATVTKDAVQLDSFQAQTKSGPVLVGQSQLWSQGSEPNQPGFCLALDLKGFDLNEAFWDAVDSDALRKLGNLNLRGRVDARGQLAVNVPKPEQGANDLVIDCNDNPLTWDNSVVGQTSGRLHIRDDGVIFSNVEVADISPESLPKEHLSEKTGRLLSQIDPKGKVGIHLKEGFLKTGPLGPKQIDVHAKITANNLSLGEPNIISGLDGNVQGHLVFDFDSDNWQTTTRYNINQFIFQDRIVRNLSGKLVFDPNSMQLESNKFTATLYDGDIRGTLRVNLPPDKAPGYQLGLDYEGVDIQKLLAAAKKNPQQSGQGSASGRLALEGEVADFSTWRGIFRTKAVNLKMGRQSLLGKILTAVQLKQPENFVFSQIDVDAAVVGPKLIFDQIRMDGNPLIFQGTGRVNIQNRQVELDLASWDRKSEETILETLARGIGSALWKVEVRGTLESPK
ncbi:MAG: hypothetical protein ACYSOR_05640, partial [Planctomycetota bacterium]